MAPGSHEHDRGFHRSIVEAGKSGGSENANEEFPEAFEAIFDELDSFID